MKFADGLCLLFIYLQLTGQIEWSWWWVLAPLIVKALWVTVEEAHEANNRKNV